MLGKRWGENQFMVKERPVIYVSLGLNAQLIGLPPYGIHIYKACHHLHTSTPPRSPAPWNFISKDESRPMLPRKQSSEHPVARYTRFSVFSFWRQCKNSITMTAQAR